MTRIRFEEVALKATRKFVDPVSGKTRQKTAKFWQTISPFNRAADGTPKTRDQIMAELRAERDAWMAEPIPKEPSNV